MNPIADAVSGFFTGIVKPILDKWIPDANERLAAEQQILNGMLALDLGQMEVNKVEAANTSMLVAGWRPILGWVCASAFGWEFVARPFVLFFITVFGVHVDVSQLPTLNGSELSTILFGMLGLGTMRSYEKTTIKK